MYRKIKINPSTLLIRNFASKKMVEDIAKVLKFKKLSTQNIYPLKILFLNESKVKTFSAT